MGEKILVRLRPAGSPDTFLPEEDLVGTMLHEVCPLLRLVKSEKNLTSSPIYSANP